MIVKRVETEVELRDAQHIRKQVFVYEQNVPIELELDEYEHDSVHFIAYKKQVPVGAARVRKVDGNAKVERVCVLKKYRRLGIGYLLMEEIEAFAMNQNWVPIRLHAQLNVVPFYKELGYTPCSERFYEANIPHIAMKKER
ncbi:GNAT family N-acetyltransferase [Pueribacillus sp. YX66]|uniref:GNAT family N-acetyltransferase n=1 Tax=Pueribacillus sp. YX66 TaxID=3229242 RepID=UPI00358D2344